MPDTPAQQLQAAAARLNAQREVARNIGAQLRAEDEARNAPTPPLEEKR